jgi:multicomponent Na+:H+ antiporter subunit G
MTIAATVLVLLGIFFLMMATLGILRFPDFFTRMHAAGKCDTLGSLLVLLGLAFMNGFDPHHLQGSLKIVFIAVFIFLTSPTATHAIARAAFKNKMPMWTKNKEGK